MRARSLVTYRVQCSSFFPSTLLWRVVLSSFFFFFFQAEDGIRDGHVTGVQTCALPISKVHLLFICMPGFQINSKCTFAFSAALINITRSIIEYTQHGYDAIARSVGSSDVTTGSTDIMNR